MNKTLKKTLSIILTILMIVTTVPFAFAAGDGVPLTIDVTDKTFVVIGGDYGYYDEDGYILTGTASGNIEVDEACNLTLNNVTASRLDMSAPDDSVVNIAFEGSNEVAGSVELYKEHLVFEGSDDATFKASYLYNGGNSDSTVTLNGGNMVLEAVDERYYTISCGNFIINGGTVTASNDSNFVILSPVKLNSGTLNVIGTSAYDEAINDEITMKKGAMLTVSSETEMLAIYGKILLADDAAETDYFFVRYDTESEFVPVYDIEAALEGKTYAEIKIDTHEHTLDNKGNCDECSYSCPHENITDYTCTLCGKYMYAITHQPTDAEPYVELNDDTDASYQWYSVEGDRAEITDKNAFGDWQSIGAPFNNSVYEDGKWITDTYNDLLQYYFIIELEAGDTINFEFASEVEAILFEINGEFDSAFAVDGTEYSITVEESGAYWLATLPVDYVRAYTGSRTYTAIDGETAAAFTPTALGNYACEVTFADGTKEMSDIFEVTKLHDCEFSGEWKYDGLKHWKECECSLTSEVATHSFTDGKCVCGVERADYTDFDAAVEELRALLAREDLLDGPKQGYTSGLNGVLNDVLNGVGYNRIEKEQMAVNNGTQTLNGYIAAIKAGIENGSMIKADFTYMTALFAEINELIGSDSGKIIPSQRGLYTGTLAYYNGCSNSPTFTQQNYNSNISYEKYLEALLAGLKDSSMLVADYTEIDEAIKAIDEALENATINDEMTAELEDIKADLEALKADANTSTADLANSGLLARAEAITETMNNCANGVHAFTKYEETEAPKCGVAGKEVAECDNGCGKTDEKEISALTHKDDNGDYLCDNDCGHKFEKPVDPTPDTPDEPTDEPTDDNCDHLCHKDGILGFFWKIISFLQRLFGIQQYCDCGVLHYDAPVFG